MKVIIMYYCITLKINEYSHFITTYDKYIGAFLNKYVRLELIFSQLFLVNIFLQDKPLIKWKLLFLYFPRWNSKWWKMNEFLYFCFYCSVNWKILTLSFVGWYFLPRVLPILSTKLDIIHWPHGTVLTAVQHGISFNFRKLLLNIPAWDLFKFLVHTIRTELL